MFWIVFLIIAGIGIGILLYIMLVPLFYKVNADLTEKNVDAVIGDFLRFYRIKAGYRDGKVYYHIRVLFGIVKILSSDDKDDPKKIAKKEAKKKKKEEKKALKAEKKGIEPAPKKTKKEVAQKFIGIIKDKRNKPTFKFIMNKVGEFAKRLFPKTIRGNIKYSAGEPDVTGISYGAIAAAVPLIQTGELYISPDFDRHEGYVEGDLLVKGRLQIVFAVFLGIKLISNKGVRSLIKQVLAK